MSAIRKEDSMLLQKQMISDHYDRLASARRLRVAGWSAVGGGQGRQNAWATGA